MFFLFFLLGSGVISANPILKKQLTKEIHKSFDVDSDALLGVQNKYGDIKITTWGRNIIEVDVLIKVKTGSESKAKEYLEGINVEFSSSSSKVGMKTIYPDQESSSWWSSWWDNSNNIDYEVHYMIRAPEGISTNLINKYGTISQTSIGGSSDVTNKYGDIYFDNVGGDLTLDLGYGKSKVANTKNVTVEIKCSTLKIESCENLKMTSKYSDFSFGDCGNMVLSTKYDEFTIESAKQIENSGKYDDFRIGIAESLIVDTKYSTIEVKELLKKCQAETKYGSVQVKSTGAKMESISVESKYTDYRFGVSSDFSINFIGDRSDLSINVPHEKYHSEKDGNELSVKAYRGNKNAMLKISADLKYGGLIIHENR